MWFHHYHCSGVYSMHRILTQLLAIPNYKVVGVEMSDDTITLDIESILGYSKCPGCDASSTSLEAPSNCERHTHQWKSLLFALCSS